MPVGPCETVVTVGSEALRILAIPMSQMETPFKSSVTFSDYRKVLRVYMVIGVITDFACKM